MQRYWLSAHAHFCLTDDYAVLLDLKGDQYIALDAPQMRALCDVVPGWPREAAQNTHALRYRSVDTDPEIVEQLHRRGLLTNDPSDGRNGLPTTTAVAQRALLDRFLSETLAGDLNRPWYGSGVRDLLRLIASFAIARALLRGEPIHAVVARIRSRKARLRRFHEPFNWELATNAVARFRILSPVVFTTRNACLVHALTLIEFLARYGLYPNWIFGVRTGPFAAHCWVQENDVVFNDSPEHVRSYSPILVV
jgi:hypothetical protein